MITSPLGAKIARAGMTAMLAAAILGGTVGLSALTAQAAVAQPTAHQGRVPETRPPGRELPSFAYDPPHHELVMFGGDNGATVFGDTWIQRHGRWAQRHPARSPSPRTGAAMAYDTATRQLLLFGGSALAGTGGGFLNDTWTWTGRTWRHLHPATSPPARHNANMVYDAATGNIVLFGGYNGQRLNDTWTWTGTTWTQQQAATSPSPRESSLAYDPATHTAILYGGFNGITAFTDTWAWTGTTWTQLTPATSPGPVTPGWQMAYDPASRQLLLFGGGLANHTNSQATWDFNGTTWTRLHPATAPAGRGAGSMTYDRATKQIVLFGGTGRHQHFYPANTWAWNGTTWHRTG